MKEEEVIWRSIRQATMRRAEKDKRARINEVTIPYGIIDLGTLKMEISKITLSNNHTHIRVRAHTHTHVHSHTFLHPSSFPLQSLHHPRPIIIVLLFDLT